MTRPRPDMAQHDADDPWDRAHVIPDFDTGPRWASWIAAAAIIGALLAVGFIAGRMTADAAERQAAICMEGCPE